MKNRTPQPIPDSAPDCTAFELVIQRVLDGELPADQLHNPHTENCSDCRSLASALTGFAALPLPVPAVSHGFNNQILNAVVHDRRQRRLRRLWVGAGSLAAAACLVIGVSVALNKSTNTVPPEIVAVTPTPAPTPIPTPTPKVPETVIVATPRVTDQVAEAGSVLSAMTRRATDQAMTPTRSFFAAADQMTVPNMGLSQVSEPATESLAALPSAAKSGVEPIADTTRRAVNLFLRDVGIAPKSKS